MKLVINGSRGRMGKEVVNLCKDGYRGAELVASVDRSNTHIEGESLFTKLDEFLGEADCIIDFTNHEQTGELTQYAINRNLPLVIATTGQTVEELHMIREAGKNIPIFLSANMSLGVALLVELAKTTAKVMVDADIEIIESHHNRKVDAPSGTALMIADAIKEIRTDAEFKMGRSGFGKRRDNEIGIHAIRMGNIMGTHEVIVGSDSQTITLKHEVHNRVLFAEGAVAAAEFLVGKEPGVYNMQDMIQG